MKIAIDSNIFLNLMFEEPGWDNCGRLLDSVHSHQHEAVISSIQLSEMYTPFERAKDPASRERLCETIKKAGVKVRDVDEETAALSSRIRGTERTPKGRWLALADSIVLATAQIEGSEILYTLDLDFLKVTGPVNVAAPGMSLEEWGKVYGPKKNSRSKTKNSMKSVC